MRLFGRNQDENELYSLDDELAESGRSTRWSKLWMEFQEREAPEGSLLQRAGQWAEESIAQRIMATVLMLVLVGIALALVLLLSSALGGRGEVPEPEIRPVSMGLDWFPTSWVKE